MLRFAIGFLAAIAHASAIASPSVSAEEERPRTPETVNEAKLAEASQAQSPRGSSGRKQSSWSDEELGFSLDDELILQLRVKGIDATDTIIAYGTRDGLYLPLGELARILDLAIRVSDEGHYGSGWYLDEARTVTIDLRQGRLLLGDESREIRKGEAQAFEGELFLRSEIFAEILPLQLEPSLRTQSVLLTTLEPFPFEERRLREAQRQRLGAHRDDKSQETWPREETPWLLASLPMTDVELRAVSDSPKGPRLETDLRLTGDLAYMTAQTFFSINTRDGLLASLIQMGRRDADGDLLGPLGATEFQLGDVGSSSMPIGLRGRSGRGAYFTNRPLEQASVFEQVDLRGVLPSGYEVELYRNEVLLGSVGKADNGQYEFLQVPVDYGLNVFRLVFYGPQGQRREEVRQISVGDGRLASGELEYEFGAVQRDVSLLGIKGPDFQPRDGYGTWQATGRVSYGLSRELTALASIAGFENDGSYNVTATAGLRTSLRSMALRIDNAVSSDGGFALGAGIGKKIAGGSLTFSHFEYGGGFVDEVRSSARAPLSRSSDLTFNTTLKVGLPPIPVVGRARYAEFDDGKTFANAAIRMSSRLFGILLSNSLEYSRTAEPNGTTSSQLLGNFDLATFKRSRVQLRGSVGYRVLQRPDFSNVSGAIDYQLDDRSIVSGQASYSVNGGGLGLGTSGVREFDRFTVALDGTYTFGKGSYSAALRVGFSFGRDPMLKQFYLARPGQALFGAASIRAFQDMDGDGSFGAGDRPLPHVNFAVFNDVGQTDDEGYVRLSRLGNGNRVSIQVDPTSLPDILMAPVNRGIEIIPRPGRFHTTVFPIVALSEVEGVISFEREGSDRGVSGIRLQLVNEEGAIWGTARSERDGYFFIEQVKPGAVRLEIEPEQARSLGLCLIDSPWFEIGSTGKTHSKHLRVRMCD